MVKNAISDYSSTAASNTDVGGVNIDEGMSPSGVNNAIRELMSHLADLNAGSSSLGTIKVDNLQLDGNAITSTDTNGNITLTPNGTGSVVIDGINYPQADGTANYFLKTDGAGQLSFAQVDTASIAADAIDGTKIADDSIDSEHIADNAVGAAALNVSGNGTSGQVLASDGDGTFSWADSGGGFTPNSVTGTTPSLDVGSYNFFHQGTHTGNTTLSFTNVPTEANWKYTFKAGGDSYALDTFIFDKSFHVEEIAADNSLSLFARDIKFKTDGTKMYINDMEDGYVWQYSLSTAWDVSTASYESKKYTTLGAEAISGIDFKSDGTVMFAFEGNGGGDRKMYSVPLSTAWDISTAGSATASTLIINQALAGEYYGLHFKPDGTKFYMAADSGSGGNNYIFEYTLSTAYDVSTITYTDVYVVEGVATLRGLMLNDDGTKLFTVDNGQDYILEHTLSTAYDLTTASYSKHHYIQTEVFISTGSALAFGDSGKKFYMGSRSVSNAVTQFRVGDPYTLTLPSSVQNRLSPKEKYVPDDIVTYEFYTTDGGTNVYIINDNVT